MKVSREQATKNRAHVVEVAGAEFRKHGFDGIGVADLMQAAGLTHGGFYNNFATKDALAAEAVTRVFAETTERLRQYALAATDPYAATIRFYLSPEHRNWSNPAAPSPLCRRMRRAAARSCAPRSRPASLPIWTSSLKSPA